LDKRSCEFADTVLLDTNSHIDFFVEAFGLKKSKFRRLLVGADEDIFFPRMSEEHEGFQVLYYGTFRPLQGIEYVVEAAKLLESHKDIRFKIIGKGVAYARIIQLVRRLSVSNISFVDKVAYEALPYEIAQADICLGGHFSNLSKAQRVIAGKTFQMIAMKKPIIVGDTPANRELFSSRENALMPDCGNGASLAEAIVEMYENEDLRDKLARNAYATFLKFCTTQAIGNEMKNIAAKLLAD